MAKRFKEAAAAARPVYSTIIGSARGAQEVQDVQDTHDAQEPQYTQDVQKAHDTQEAQHVQEVQEPHNTQSTQEVQHAQEVRSAQDTQEAPPTQGKKGARLPRINMAFSEENLAYLRIMAALEGQSVTRYVNALIEEDRRRREGAYRAARQLAASGKGA